MVPDMFDDNVTKVSIVTRLNNARLKNNKATDADSRADKDKIWVLKNYLVSRCVKAGIIFVQGDSISAVDFHQISENLWQTNGYVPMRFNCPICLYHKTEWNFSM